MLYPLLRPLFFSLPTETAHRLALQLLPAAQWLGAYRSPVVAGYDFCGWHLPNRIGLAAGFDKNGEHLSALSRLGFGMVEIGTVTPLAQAGNPRPRLFRLVEKQAVINRMGFNNHGLATVLARLQATLPERHSRPWVLGINLGKNAATPLEHAVDDYLLGLHAAAGLADYLTINISSPNTQGLRSLQGEEALTALLRPLVRARQEVAADGRRLPLFVKIAPDLDDDALAGVLDVICREGADGVIATNTTLDRTGVAGHRYAAEAGGLSGAPLTDRALAVLERVRRQVGPHFPLIGSGGVMSGQDVRDRIAAGANIVQLYSGMVYRGPALVAEAIQAVASAASNGSAGG